MPNFITQFNGQTAIITGAGSGIGAAIAWAFAESGANVVINDLNPDRVETLVTQLQEAGHSAAGFQGDMANRFQAAALIERARDAFGRIDFFINAAGIFKAEPLQSIDEWDIRRQLEVNIIGTFFGLQLISRVMADEGGGVILNLASTAGHPHPIEQGIGYVSSKSGVIGMTKQAAVELAQYNIRVNAICPANIYEPDMPRTEPRNALQRIGEAEEVASVALFLCSDAARFITGQALNVDGGESFV